MILMENNSRLPRKETLSVEFHLVHIIHLYVKVQFGLYTNCVIQLRSIKTLATPNHPEYFSVEASKIY
jgi:hypothetical protein